MGKIRKTLALAAAVIMAAIIVLSGVGGVSLCAYAGELDRITDYTIRVNMLEDGSMQMEYSIDWTVLSNSGGPLTWVKIGIPNSNADNITAQTSNIKKASYYSESGGDYIRIDFNGSYRAGQSFNFKFSFTQHNMFQEESGGYVYNFTPGWFDNIRVDQYTIYWNTDKATSAGTSTVIDGYYVWTGSLAKGQKVSISVHYPSDAYTYRTKNVFHGFSKMSSFFQNGGGKFALYILVIIATFMLRLRRFIGDDYDGDGYRGGYHGGFHGGGGCACACACACAGGGRAGCSKKDFYGTKISTARVRKILRKMRKEDAESEDIRA